MTPIKQITLTLLAFLFAAVSLHAADRNAELRSAEKAYADGNYPAAAEQYEALIKNYGDAAEVYYNLGNAYYKLGRIAPAILNYERALVMNPGDGDTRFNLEMARQRTADRIEPADGFFGRAYRSVQHLLSVDGWAAVGLICFVAFAGCLVLFFFSKWMRLRKTGFYLGLLLLFITVMANVFAWGERQDLIVRDAAIVFTPTVTIKSSPDRSGTDLFILHEGTKVTIKNTLGEWYEIRLGDGKEGWIPSKDLERI